MQTFTKMVFESNVILDRYKTINLDEFISDEFESNVILDRYKTIVLEPIKG